MNIFYLIIERTEIKSTQQDRVQSNGFILFSEKSENQLLDEYKNQDLLEGYIYDYRVEKIAQMFQNIPENLLKYFQEGNRVLINHNTGDKL